MPSASATELARGLTAADPELDRTGQLGQLEPAEWIALAWAVKDECQAAWVAEPPRTRRCAEVAAQVARRCAEPEVAAAGAWCAGLALLAQGRMHDAIARLDEAHDRLRAIGQPRRAAQAQVPKVIALSKLGRHDEALASGTDTLQQLAAAGDELGAGKAELNLGWMLMGRARYPDAIRFFKRAAVRFALAGDVTHSIMADLGVASALTWQFDFDEASRLYNRCEARVRARRLGSLLSVVDTNRGRMDLHRGRLEPALRSLEAALRQAEADGSPHDIGEALRDLADAYLALNLLPEAIALYGRTIDSCKALDAPLERAWAEIQRALALARCGDPAAAMQGVAQARQAFVAAGNELGIAVADLRRAGLALQTGAHGTALAVAHEAAGSLAACGVEGWRREAELLAADALLAGGDVEAARAQYERVLEAAAGLPQLRAPCRTGLGLCHWRSGQRKAARAQFLAAVRETEALRETLPGDEFRTAFGADKQRPYDALMELALDEHDARAPWRLLTAIERARAPALRSALGRGKEAGALDEARRERLHWLQAQWQQALGDEDMERAAQLQAQMRVLEQAWLEQTRRAQAASGAAPRAAASGLALPDDEAAVRERLPQDTAVVVYAVLDRRLAACVITRRAVHRVVGSAETVAERVGQLRFQIDALRHGAPALRRHAAQMALRCQAHLQALHASLWQPLSGLLAPCERVVVIPHRELHYVPFPALHDGRASLVEQHEISLAPGLALWLAPAPTPRPWRRVAALGVGGTALPHVAQEVHAVAQAFEACPGGAATLLLEAQATQAALRAALAEADVVHLACHGQFRADSPYFSALHLADGPLTLRDAADLPLAAQLVTLSACETGLSRIAPGDEQLGLLRGFLMAGAPRVLSTHWTVDDASTAQLMKHFYRDLLGGARPAAALRAAQRALAREHPHPYHWAAFALHERGH